MGRLLRTARLARCHIPPTPWVNAFRPRAVFAHIGLSRGAWSQTRASRRKGAATGTFAARPSPGRRRHGFEGAGRAASRKKPIQCMAI